MPYPSETRRTSGHFNGVNYDILMPEWVLPRRSDEAPTARAFEEVQNERDAALVLLRKSQIDLQQKCVELEEASSPTTGKGDVAILPDAKVFEELRSQLDTEKSLRKKAEMEVQNKNNELTQLKHRLSKLAIIQEILNARAVADSQRQVQVERIVREEAQKDVRPRGAAEAGYVTKH